MFNGYRDKSTCTAGTKRGGGESSERFGKGGGQPEKREKQRREEEGEGEGEGGGPFQGDLRGAHVVRFPCTKKKNQYTLQQATVLPSAPSPPPRSTPPPETRHAPKNESHHKSSTFSACLATR